MKEVRVGMSTLLEKLYLAVENKSIDSPFTTKDLKNWINKYTIINNSTRTNYSSTYIEGFLSSSTLGSSATKTDKSLIQFETKPKSYSFINNNGN